MSLQNKTVVLRADGSEERGIGHLMRCLALADGIAGVGGRALLASTAMPDAVAALYQARGIEILQLGTPERHAEQMGALAPEWLVFDSYDISAAERAALARTAQHIAVIDDTHDNGPYEADLVINPNPFSDPSRYGDTSAALAVGTDYVLLRSEVLRAKRQQPAAGGLKVLISCGGSDPTKAADTCLAILAERQGPPLTVHILAGPLAQSAVALEAGDHDVTMLRASTAIQDHLNWADVAILAAGTTQWEAAYLGCPFIALIVADNQAGGAQAFAQAGGSLVLDWRGERPAAPFLAAFESLQRDGAQQAMRAQSLIDGYGAQRVAALMGQIV